MRIITYNVNGIRAAIAKGFLGWLAEVDADVVCLQEVKAQVDQIPLMEFEMLGYHHFWFPAKKKGYSGVAILSKSEPDNVVYGMNGHHSDEEGRFVRIDIAGCTFASVYVPSGSSGEVRQDYKMKWLLDFQEFADDLRRQQPRLILSGDVNICHKAVDIHDPVRNAKNSGFLPEEREWLSNFLENGFVDAFREYNQEPNQYTWWSYRANARARNLGWRIDYHLVSVELAKNIRSVKILSNAIHSDHCPVLLELNNC